MLVSGSSAPALVEAGGRRFVLKLRGAGPGPRALAAEYVAGEIGRRLGLNVPTSGPLRLGADIAAQERHAELSDLLRASAGVNLGIEYLDGADDVPRLETPGLPPGLASRIVWFDALVKNVDRTARNPNLMKRGGEWWLIDHGACRVFDDLRDGFAPVRDHLLLRQATELAAVDERSRALLSPEFVRSVVQAVPNEWWDGTAPGDLLQDRLARSAAFVGEVEAYRAEPPDAGGPPPDRRPSWARRPR